MESILSRDVSWSFAEGESCGARAPGCHVCSFCAPMMDNRLSSESDPEELYIELLRLQREVDETNQQKIQAAEYGLAVLQEKQNLQEQLEQLELVNEQTSGELQQLKQVIYERNEFVFSDFLNCWVTREGRLQHLPYFDCPSVGRAYSTCASCYCPSILNL